VKAPDAVDRKTLSSRHDVKAARWPRTARRQARIRSVLARRQPDLTVVLENIHDPHNVSAILRTCDAVGVLAAHVVYTVEELPAGAFSRETSASAAKWVSVVQHQSIAACYDHLREAGFAIAATALCDGAKPLFEWEFTKPVAVVLGNEMRGISNEARELADGVLAIPMVGMVQSLNVSVAAAVCLYEAFRQRLIANAYAAPRLDEGELTRLEDDWLRR
jgi:tRNA (guanosine-2'-O-)-methyltransferase